MTSPVGGAWRLGTASSVLSLLCACQVYGLIGSNPNADTGSVDSGAETGVSTSTGFADDTTSIEPHVTTGSSTGLAETSTGTTDALVFDVGPGDGPEVCLAPLSTSCDQGSEDPWQALGIDCPGSFTTTTTAFSGHPAALHVHKGLLGTHGEYTPREGERMVILSTGRAADVPRTHEDIDCVPELCPSSALDPWSSLPTLPPPIDVQRVDTARTCADDPTLVGTGDCSNTLQDEWEAGSSAYDYAELRMTAKVPDEADALIYQFAFFSAEYPLFASQNAPWNDMYVAWLESEAWTGNISFDDQGNPISINGVFLDYVDAEGPLCKRTPCEAPQLDGFAMDGHAGTRWLETVAPVVPGEEIEVVFGLFDLSDAWFDTVVLLDNVHWGCTDLPPLTQPEG
ncbi:choice-of-anchor L domain-containing protein [Paraliomyxa miuraensis]|uniref:choice-of-anchor L domain-containing protein n=1 Tax=Paraliomyxa miuraensis TaxID=376150 RepID=UPI00225B8B65|nr:choice-of-anchor L domain-containing protein [Paraliomyxa miuraensis]MCX4242664.1 choice-of-anchor L domain-containing protein [Paraliomyxa miuraensis]